MLTDRQNKILKIIVERYIKEPVPVGSKSISTARFSFFFENKDTLFSAITSSLSFLPPKTFTFSSKGFVLSIIILFTKFEKP